jgi:hypothetical protein
VGESERLRNCQRHFCELGSRTVIDKGAYAVGLFAEKRSSEGSELNQSHLQIPGDHTDMTTLNKGSSETSGYACCIKELAEAKEAIIDLDLENVRQRMQLKDEIAELEDKLEYVYGLLEDANAEIKRLRAEHSSGSQSKKKALEKVGTPNSNANLRAPSSVKCEEIEH